MPKYEVILSRGLINTSLSCYFIKLTDYDHKRNVRANMGTRIIALENYNANWPTLYDTEQVLVKNIIGDNLIASHHIGSTSVANLPAKAIIDILLEVSNLSALENSYLPLENIGYVAKGENGIAGRRYFQKGGMQRSHHLHVFKQGSVEVIRHLAFRNYLRKHPDIAQEYGELKYRIAQQCENNNQVYMAGKSDFIKKHLALAMAENF